MYPRLSLLAGACLALGVTAALHAEELQVNFTGSACSLPGGVACGTYVVAFDVDTLSGHQQQGIGTVNGVPSVIGFDSGALSVTNFYESFAGKSTFVRSTTGALSFSALPTVSDLGIGVHSIFFWDSANPVPPIPASQFSLANYLFDLSGATLDADGSLMPGVGINNGTIRVSAVPEPGTLALVLVGLAGLGFMQWAPARARMSKSAGKG